MEQCLGLKSSRPTKIGHHCKTVFEVTSRNSKYQVPQNAAYSDTTPS